MDLNRTASRLEASSRLELWIWVDKEAHSSIVAFCLSGEKRITERKKLFNSSAEMNFAEVKMCGFFVVVVCNEFHMRGHICFVL